jgi:hypothetical protein
MALWCPSAFHAVIMETIMHSHRLIEWSSLSDVCSELGTGARRRVAALTSSRRLKIPCRFYIGILLLIRRRVSLRLFV